MKYNILFKRKINLKIIVSKSKGTIIFFCLLSILSFSNVLVVDKEISKNLNIDKAPNNVPLVNIEAPNSNGLSHNMFKEYNVDNKGIILNNTVDFKESKLGGLIYGNPNFQNNKQAASTILTEVSGVNKSKIEGFTEIVGKQADYILANPNGIYVNGAGFINTGNVKMVTASSKNNFEVENGKIEIAGQGLDLRNINKADLITRITEIYAPIYAGDELNIKLGSTSKENKPEFALDGRALGSMYAGRITIVSNEDGVGVKSQGITYADKGDIIISSKGKVYLKNTQAKNSIGINSSGIEISDKLLAEDKINVTGNTKNQGQIRANNQIEVKGNLENNS